MGTLTKEYIVIDWGFTRLKLWSLNQNRKIIKEKYIYIKDLNPNPEFYLLNSFKKISNEIINFIEDSRNLNTEINILSSCQMHCLAGILESDEPFLSTWNDMPNKKKGGKILVKNGQPTLLSMPINKIFFRENAYYLSTKNIKKIFNKDEIKIKNFMTPFQLIYNYFLDLEIAPSFPFWESTCLPKTIISKKFYKQKKYSESFLDIKNSKIIRSDNPIKIFPEIGDLQASTYSSLTSSDIVINLGTGSQVMFKESIKFSKKNYFRFFPNIGKVSVISHIPCGRVFSDYCQNTKYIYKDLIEAFDSLNIKIFNSFILEDYSLLYFPGFDTKEFKYLNKNDTSIDEICTFPPIKIICLWLNQYIKIIKTFNEYYQGKSNLKITICGDLGGISLKAIKFLREFLPNKYSFSLSETNVPLSLIKCLETSII